MKNYEPQINAVSDDVVFVFYEDKSYSFTNGHQK
jgi:hypothetical protein